jgi:hypothetical protein
MNMSKPRIKFEVHQAGELLGRHTNLKAALFRALRAARKPIDPSVENGMAFVWELGKGCVAGVQDRAKSK